MMINGMFPGTLAPTETVAGCIDIYEDAWPFPLETIQMVEEECANPDSGLSWTRAETTGEGYRQNVRTNYNMGITYQAEMGSPVAQNVHNQMYMLLLATSVDYNKRYGVHEPLWHEHYNMLKYSTGQEYHAHYDGGTGSGRSLSAIVYLNDDYEGGHVEFVNYGVKIKPKPGMLLLFPSSYAYRHIAHPVTSGTKYAIVTWLHDRPL
jgi:predicted 2-oxoglutarate/Fe(II)-dependent dioxygenase YbiX